MTADENIISCCICNGTLAVAYIHNGKSDTHYRVEKEFYVTVGNHVCSGCRLMLIKQKKPTRKAGAKIPKLGVGKI